jgi:hypothetical protein
MWGDRNRVFIHLSMDLVDDADLLQLEADASDLGHQYANRERGHIAAAMYAIAGIADAARTERERADPDAMDFVSWSAPVEFDVTSNAEHNKDDLGTLMAQAMAQAERQDIGDDLAYIWFSVVRQLARERDRLRQVGAIL